jgi:hypothetical protein
MDQPGLDQRHRDKDGEISKARQYAYEHIAQALWAGFRQRLRR